MWRPEGDDAYALPVHEAGGIPSWMPRRSAGVGRHAYESNTMLPLEREIMTVTRSLDYLRSAEEARDQAKSVCSGCEVAAIIDIAGPQLAPYLRVALARPLDEWRAAMAMADYPLVMEGSKLKVVRRGFSYRFSMLGAKPVGGLPGVEWRGEFKARLVEEPPVFIHVDAPEREPTPAFYS